MTILPIISIILLTIMIVLIFSIIKNLFKAVFLSLFVISLAFGIGAYFIYQDIIDIKENFNSQDKLLILVENEKVLTGVSIKELNDIENFKPLNESYIKIFEDSYANQEFIDFTDKYYKILLYNLSAFSASLDNGINLGDGNNELSMSKEQIMKILHSEDKFNDFYEMVLSKNNQLPEDTPDEIIEAAKNETFENLGFKSSKDIDGYLFMMMIADNLYDLGPATIITQIKDKDIKVIPNTALFKAIGFIPDKVLSKTLNIIVPEKEA